MNSGWRFPIVVVLLGATALLLHARNSAEIILSREDLKFFPHEIPGWTSQDIPLQKEVLDVLGPGDFLLRDYQKIENRSDVGLFIAYFPSQRSGDTIHSPKNCLPGAGWSPMRADRIKIQLPGRDPFPANRYLIVKGADRMLVLYWYWAHNRAVASEYSAKFYLVTDSIRMHRSDGSLIRITTGIGRDENIDAAQQRLLSFAAEVVPLMDRYVPR